MVQNLDGVHLIRLALSIDDDIIITAATGTTI